ncbi:MAG TPA: glycosyltransferase [Longimicrobiales bacterium]|nr:glycosyltransferase [Longimicrobiales bacterium]
MTTAALIFSGILLGYFLLLNGIYLGTTVFAFFALRRYAARIKSLDIEELLTFGDAPPITLITPAYNEASTCVEATRALLAMRYPAFDVVIVNDGSQDDTLERLRGAFALEPATRLPMASLPTAPVRGMYHSRAHRNLWLIDKANGGKADALNCGLNYCRAPMFCALDADTLLEPDALIRVIRPFLENRTTIAAGGIIRIVNGSRVRNGRVEEVRLPHTLLGQVQVLEYLRAFLSGRLVWAQFDAMLIISGAFGLFRRSMVIDAGGFSTTTVGEDMELVVRLHRYARERRMPYRIRFVPDPVAWTECPETLRVLGRQRDRWQRGLAQSLLRHQRMLFNPRYGRVGMVAFPFFYFLEMIGPLVEAIGYIAFFGLLAAGLISVPFTIAFFCVAFLLGVSTSIAAVSLEELTFRRYRRTGDLARLFLLAVLENFGYRQLLTYWRVRGMLTLRRQRWGAMARTGFEPAGVP